MFGEISPLGVGTEPDLGIKDFIFKNSAIKLCIGYNFIFEELEAIDSFGMLSMAFLAGYAVVGTDVFSITPLAGGGYLGHAVDAGEQLMFFDPHLSLQTEFDLSLGEDFFVSLTPGFILFFEQNNNVGSYFSVNLGVKKAFNIELGGEKPLLPQPEPGLPQIIIERDLPMFSPNGDGSKDIVVLTISADGNIPVKSCELKIVNKDNKPVRTFSGGLSLSQRFEWDGRDNKSKLVADAEYRAALTVSYDNGRANNGVLVESAKDYPLKLEVIDGAGNKASVNDVITTDILIRKYGDKRKVMISNIYFEAYNNDFLKGDQTMVKKNLTIIDRLEEIFKKLSTYKIIIVGHALNVYSNDKVRAEKEEGIIIPLSTERAESIKKALIERGIDAGRITTEGKGSSEPLVPINDENNQWKNRRVEIIIEKK
jgi:outer membrane protein OmpA-like peptidoglycan-associated protein